MLQASRYIQLKGITHIYVRHVKMLHTLVLLACSVSAEVMR